MQKIEEFLFKKLERLEKENKGFQTKVEVYQEFLIQLEPLNKKYHAAIKEIDYRGQVNLKQEDKVKKYRKEIVELRGKAYLSCPNCYEDCIGWVSDGVPCIQLCIFKFSILFFI